MSRFVEIMTLDAPVSTKTQAEKTENNEAVVTIIPTMHDEIGFLTAFQEVALCP